MPAAGDSVASADILLALNRRIGTLTAETDAASAVYSSETIVDTVTVAVVAGRTYRVKWVFQWNPASASSVTQQTRIRAGTAAGSQLTYRESTNATTNPGEVYILEVDWTASVTGNQQFSGTGLRTAGSVNSIFRGATSRPRSLTVEYAYG